MEYIKERDCLKSLKPYSVPYVDADIFLDANENPYPMPDKVRRAVMERLEEVFFNRYPEITAHTLRAALAASLGLDVEEVEVGNGSSELLSVCCQVFGGPGKKIAYPVPSFSMYEVYARMSDSTPVPYRLSEDFSLDVAALQEFLSIERPDILIICNPNNPTGNLTQAAELRSVLDKACCLVLADEAYMEFADQSLLPLLGSYPQLAVLRTFSKAYGLASARVGYMAASKHVAGLVGKVLLPYHVNALSLAVAEEVYRRREAYQPSIKAISLARDALAEDLVAMGCRVVPSAANFLFFSAGSAQKSAQLARYLLQERIAVRDFTGSPALGGLRLTVGTEEENKKVLAAVKIFLERGEFRD